MFFFYFCTTFSFGYICSSTVAYLIFLDLSKHSDFKKWFDKKFNLGCSQQAFVLLDRRFIFVYGIYLYPSFGRIIG